MVLCCDMSCEAGDKGGWPAKCILAWAGTRCVGIFHQFKSFQNSTLFNALRNSTHGWTGTAGRKMRCFVPNFMWWLIHSNTSHMGRKLPLLFSTAPSKRFELLDLFHHPWVVHFESSLFSLDIHTQEEYAEQVAGLSVLEFKRQNFYTLEILPRYKYFFPAE